MKFSLPPASTMSHALLLAYWVSVVSAFSHGDQRIPYGSHPRSWRYQNNVVRHGDHLQDISSRDTSINSTQIICKNPAPAIQAPKINTWSGLTDVETASILTWLFAQKDLNLTAHEPDSLIGNVTTGPRKPNVTLSGPEWDNKV